MLGTFLLVGEQLFRETAVLFQCGAARARPRDGPDGDLAVAQAHEDFGARADDREAGEFQEIEKRRRVQTSQRAVERKRRQRKGAAEPLTWDNLESIAGKDVLL